MEFFGEGTASLTVPDRATIANMAPEYGATMGFFPVDDATIEYFKGTGRSDEEVAALQSYFKAQELYGIPRKGDIDYSRELELDLTTVSPSLAGPRRPQDRIEMGDIKSRFTELFAKPVVQSGYGKDAADLNLRYPVRGCDERRADMGATCSSSQNTAAHAAAVRPGTERTYYGDGQTIVPYWTEPKLRYVRRTVLSIWAMETW